MTKISIRGSGIQSEDEPLGVQFTLDGLTLNQGDGEAILEDFDLATIKYAEVFRGADALRYGSITLGGAINLLTVTGYDADRFYFRLEGGSFGYFRDSSPLGDFKVRLIMSLRLWAAFAMASAIIVRKHGTVFWRRRLQI